jgi:thiol:disulfide interchange protein DsbC
MKKVIEKRADIAFYIKMFPLPSHKDAYKKSKAIVCAKSLKLLEEAFEGKALPEPKCDTKEIDENLKLGGTLGISGTPALVMPDGRVISGYKEADELIKLIDKKTNGNSAKNDNTKKSLQKSSNTGKNKK